MSITVRLATPADAAAVQEVYAPYVRDTTISFEYEVPGVEEMARRMGKVLAMYPWLVAERDGQCVGYAYASRFHPRAAYQWTVETSVYLAPTGLRQGIGTQLYRRLLDLLRAQGLCTAIAAIALPNPASVAFHESLGFQAAHALVDVGFKQGKWLGVGYWQRALGPKTESPAPPVSVQVLTEDKTVGA